MEKQYNILFAMASLVDNQMTLDMTMKSLQESGIQINRIDARGSKSLVKQYLKQNQDTDVLVLAQYPGSNAAPYTPSEIDELSIMAKDLIVIPILEDNVDPVYLRELENKGIYTALFSKDSDFGNVVKLIKEGRDKRQAREYYKITGTVTERKQIENNSGLTANLKRAFDSVVSYDGTIENLNARLNAVSETLQSYEIKELLSYLPADIFNAVRQIDRYKILCDVVEQDGLRNPIDMRAENSVAQLTIGKKTSGSSKISPLKAAEQTTGAITIGVYSTDIGIGCTYSSILFANALKKKNVNVCVVEIDDEDQHFVNLYTQLYPGKEAAYEKEFKLNGVTYIFGTDIETVLKERMLQFDYILFDMGFAPTDVIARFHQQFDKNLVVTSGADWHFGSLHTFIQEISYVDTGNYFLYAVPLAGSSSLTNVQSMVPNNHVFGIELEDNPFLPSGGTIKLATKYLSKREPLEKVKAKVREGVPLEKRVGKKGIRKIASMPVLLCCVLIAVFMSIGLVGTVAVNAVENTKMKAANREMEILAGYHKKEQELQSIYDRVPIETTVFVLTKDVLEGEVITAAAYEQQSLLLELSGAVVLTNIKEGMVASGNYKAGSILLNGMLSEKKTETEAVNVNETEISTE